MSNSSMMPLHLYVGNRQITLTTINRGLFTQQLRSELENIIRGYGPQMVTEAKKNIEDSIGRGKHGKRNRSRYTGNLVSTIRWKPITGGLQLYSTEKKYSRAVESGARPHYIVARGRYPLHWKDENGKDHYAWRVKHPVFKGKFMLKKAAEMFENQIKGHVELAVFNAMMRSQNVGGARP